ncbi:MAG: HAD family hydrolase [Candidatus Hodarchaeales archaeon]|jgi:putative hydrolase of the HAD superfamily
MNSFDIVSLDLFSTLVYLDREVFNPHLALKNAILKSGKNSSHIHLIDDVIKSYYLRIRKEMSDYNKETEFRNEDILREIYEEKNITVASNIKKMTADIIASYFDSAMSIIHPFPDMQNTLEFIKNKGYTLILTSNHSYPPNGWALLRKYDILKYFDKIVFSGEVGWKKPSRKIFSYALKDLEYSNKDRIIHVGDDPEADIKGALEFGIKALWVLSPTKKGHSKKISGVHGVISEIKNIPSFL